MALTTKGKAGLAVVALAVLGLALPVSNLVTPREKLEVKSADPRYREVSLLLQGSCADCHTPNLTRYPIYFELPIARDIIGKDIKEARQELIGEEPLDAVQLGRLKEVIEDGTMPPLRYKLMHWNAGFSQKDRQTLLSWIASQSTTYGIKPVPETNPFSPDKRKVALGKSLFNDKRLSADDTVSCASCHALDKGGTDQAPVSTGIHGQKGPINAPTVLNAAFNFCQFWDGRAANLQEQANGPVNNPKEMGSSWPQVVAKLEKDQAFKKAFSESYAGGLTAASITDAIAAYEKTLITPDSRFDRYLAGDRSALTADEEKGYKLFLQNNCVSCHTGVNFGGLSFEKMGRRKDYFAWRGHPTEADNGRFNVTHAGSDMHKFKVPTLRNVELTFPYFHDGSVSELPEAVKIMGEFQLGKKLSDQDAGLIARFLRSLTGRLPD